MTSPVFWCGAQAVTELYQQPVPGKPEIPLRSSVTSEEFSQYKINEKPHVTLNAAPR